MDYANFVGALNKGVENYILAYDEKDDGSVLLVMQDGNKLIISSLAITHQEREVIHAIHAHIRSRDWETSHMRLVIKDNELLFEPISL